MGFFFSTHCSNFILERQLEDIIGFQDDSFASGDTTTSLPTDLPGTDPTPPTAESCDKEKVGIRLNGVSKSNVS